MSGNTTLKKDPKKVRNKRWTISAGITMGLSLLAFALAHLGANQSNKQFSNIHRLPSATNMKKLFEKHGIGKTNPIKRTQKLTRPINVYLEKQGDLEVEPGEPFVLRGSFEFHLATKEAEVHWLLPKGVDVLVGQLKETHLNIAPGQKIESEIVLVSSSDNNETIHFKVAASAGNQRFSRVVQFNTTNQEIININNAELKLKTEEYHINNKVKAPKIFK